MHASRPEVYFRAGQEALRCIRLAMLAAGKDGVDSVLDFGCAFGRVLRVLKAAFPQAQLTACDVRKQGIAFCAEAFGATPVLSTHDPGEIELRSSYDLIWSSGHLTHIPEDRWTAFVKLFESVLSPGGVLVFTTYGRAIAEMLRAEGQGLGLKPEQVPGVLRDYEERGFGFFGDMLPAGRGDTLVSPAWVCEQLDAAPSLELLLYLEHAWLGQDVIACSKVMAP